jgi:hypothetical protein
LWVWVWGDWVVGRLGDGETRWWGCVRDSSIV